MGGATKVDDKSVGDIEKEGVGIEAEMGVKSREEVHNRHVRHGGNDRAGGDEGGEARISDENEEMKVGGAAKVTGETVKNIETEVAKRGRSKRPRIHRTEQPKPQPCKPDRGEEGTNGSGSPKVGARDEVGAGAREETIRGDWEVPAEGHQILQEILAPQKSLPQKQKGAEGVGKSREENGLRSS